MEILMPTCLNLETALEFYKLLQVQDSDRYTFNYKNLGNVEPFGMLVVGSLVRRFFDEKKDSADIFDSNYDEKNYAAHMGYFKSVYLNFGKDPGEAPGSSTYIPITKLNADDIRMEAARNGIPIGEMIEAKSKDMAVMLSRADYELCEYLTYSIRELMRNIVEHSQSNEIWFAGQYWPTRNLVEIAILDEGIGISASLSENPRVNFNNAREALLLAIEPGISGKVHRRSNRRRQDPWRNSGYGLFMTSSICQRGGDFTLCSGSKAIHLVGDQVTTIDTEFEGTVVRMRIDTSRITSLTQVLDELNNEGSRRARENSEHSVLSASRVSRMLVYKDKQ